MAWFHYLPPINALLNLQSSVFLGMGFLAIRRGQVARHRQFMLTALACSVMFLASYLVYHFNVGSMAFQGEGWSRPVYFTILLSHTVLAVVNVPFVVWTLSRALKQDFGRHKKWARPTLAIWAYVSVTGVVIYLMLYVIFGPPKPRVFSMCVEAPTRGSCDA